MRDYSSFPTFKSRAYFSQPDNLFHKPQCTGNWVNWDGSCIWEIRPERLWVSLHAQHYTCTSMLEVSNIFKSFTMLRAFTRPALCYQTTKQMHRTAVILFLLLIFWYHVPKISFLRINSFFMLSQWNFRAVEEQSLHLSHLLFTSLTRTQDELKGWKSKWITLIYMNWIS